MILYHVTHWDAKHENNRSRELKRLDWLCLPNKMDGDGYNQLMTLPDGETLHPDRAAHFGGWCAILEVASKCEPRGTLWREQGRAHDARSLALKTRLPQKTFEVVIPRLVSIGWLTAENVEGNEFTAGTSEGAGKPQGGAGLSQWGAEILPPARSGARARNGIGLNGMEENTHTPPSGGGSVGANESNALTGFDRFWAVWPKHSRKNNRNECLKRWTRAQLEPLTEEILHGLNLWKASSDWEKERGRFIPAPLVWLNQERWVAADALDPAGQVAGDNGFVRAPITKEVAEAIGAPWPIRDAKGEVICE